MNELRRTQILLLLLLLQWFQQLLMVGSFSVRLSTRKAPSVTTRRSTPVVVDPLPCSQQHQHPYGRRTGQVPLRAKPPPISHFDLDAIEAFERQLDFEDDVSNAQELDDDYDAGDDDEDYDDEVNSNILSWIVPLELHDKRVDAVLAALWPEMSRSTCGALVDDGCVSLVPVGASSSTGSGGTQREIVQRKSFKVTQGRELIVDLTTASRLAKSSSATTTIVPQNLPIDILYEDVHMIVINKSPHMVVHPGAGNWDGTVVNALAYYLANNSTHGAGDFVQPCGSDEDKDLRLAAAAKSTRDAAGEVAATRPGIVHRLDKGTTGVLVVAKTQAALAALSSAFARRKVRKTYLAVCVGQPGSGPNNLVIDKPIGRHPVHRQRMRVVPEVHRDAPAATGATSRAGRRAVSIVNTIAHDGKLSMVRIRILTGRTHQIRVHLQDNRTPVCGDDVYGSSDWNQLLKKSFQIARPLLHAYQLELEHPVTGQLLSFTAPMPADMRDVAKRVYPNGEQERPDLFVQT